MHEKCRRAYRIGIKLRSEEAVEKGCKKVAGETVEDWKAATGEVVAAVLAVLPNCTEASLP